MGDPSTRPISVVGMVGEVFGAGARDALSAATVLVGSARQLAIIPVGPGAVAEPERIALRGPLPVIFDAMEIRRDAGESVCVVASGDPGFFGIVGALSERFGSDRLVVHPAPSSVSLAFALAGLPWDDATVVSAHGRPLEAAVNRIKGGKVAVLTSPDNTPEVIGRALLDRRYGPCEVLVASNLGMPGAAVVRTNINGLAAGGFPAMSVLLLLGGAERGGVDPHTAPLSWGLPESAFNHRNGMITKSEVRAIALGKLALPSTGVLWDLGAGSGSVAIECARLRPGLQVIAVERNLDDVARIQANAAAHEVQVQVVTGEAPEVLQELPDPDRVFVGGGGLDVLDAALARLRPDGAVVATFALMDRAVQAQQRLGSLVQVSLSRGVDVGNLGMRLAAENPVFLCWGPTSG